MELLDRVRATIRRHDLARPDTRVVVALSGGSDSVALAHPPARARRTPANCGSPASRISIISCAARPTTTSGSAPSWRLALAGRFAPTATMSRRAPGRERRSIEDAARAARYEFFERARVRFGADVVALGHTRDDQAETFLLRLLRGAGRAGWRRMHPRRGAIVRPLLDCRRGELRCLSRGRGDRRSSTTRRTTTSASRATACARSCCRCSSAGSIRRLSTCSPTKRSWRARSGTGLQQAARRSWPRP